MKHNCTQLLNYIPIKYVKNGMPSCVDPLVPELFLSKV